MWIARLHPAGPRRSTENAFPTPQTLVAALAEAGLRRAARAARLTQTKTLTREEALEPPARTVHLDAPAAHRGRATAPGSSPPSSSRTEFRRRSTGSSWPPELGGRPSALTEPQGSRRPRVVGSSLASPSAFILGPRRDRKGACKWLRPHKPRRPCSTPRRSTALSSASPTRSSSATPILDTLALVGIHTRGVPLAQRLRRLIAEFAGIEVALGTLDITFYRDDLYVRDGERAAPIPSRSCAPRASTSRSRA